MDDNKKLKNYRFKPELLRDLAILSVLHDRSENNMVEITLSNFVAGEFMRRKITPEQMRDLEKRVEEKRKKSEKNKFPKK